MSSEAGHIQITEFNKEVIPMINWMMEDLFCQYGVSLPWFMCDSAFPDYSQRPDWCSGYNFNLDWGEWGYWLPWFNNLLGLLFDEAHLPRLTLPDLSPGSWTFFNDYTEILYDNMQRHYVYGQSGTFTKDEVIEGETSGITGWYKWKDGDGYIHVANKQDASGESIADFEEEKIVGADSGAYFYTYEDYWEEFSRVSGEDNYIRRRGDANDYEDAKTDYEDDPDWSVMEVTAYDVFPMWGNEDRYPQTPRYRILAWQSYLDYDTRSVSTVSLAKLVFTVNSIRRATTAENPTIYIYKYDYETLDSADWSGGTKIAEREFTDADVGEDVEISLDPTDVTPGDYSKYRIILKRTEDLTYWPEPGSYYLLELTAKPVKLLLR